MNRPLSHRIRLLTFVALFTVLGLLSAAAMKVYSRRPSVNQNISTQRDNDDDDERSEQYLFVWAGDQARTNPDFLAVINFNERSRHYGQVITTVPLPLPGASGNEPHHVGLSRDGKVLACGGLLSVLRGQREIFFFDVSNPRSPRLITSADPPLSAITDEFYPLPDGGFLVTMK